MEQQELSGTSDTFDKRKVQEDARPLPVALSPKKKRKEPYKSWGTQIKENWIAGAASAILLLLLGTAVTVLWSLNREVGVVASRVDDLQKKYDIVFTSSDGNRIDVVQIKTELERDLQYIRERLQRLEFKVFQ